METESLPFGSPRRASELPCEESDAVESCDAGGAGRALGDVVRDGRELMERERGVRGGVFCGEDADVSPSFALRARV